MAEEMPKTSVVLSPQQLQLYAQIDRSLPVILTEAAIEVNRQEYRFAMVQGIFGFVLALTVVGASVYLAVRGHDWVAGTLLGAGAIAMVTGFQVSRLTGGAPSSVPKKKREAVSGDRHDSGES